MMPRSLRLLLMLVSCAAGASTPSCQKQTAAPPKEAAALLEGYWQLRQTAGGVTGRVRPADPDQRQGIVFGANGQVCFLLNGTASHPTTYTLSRAVGHNTQRLETFITYGPATTRPTQYISALSDSELVLADDYPDGLSTTYRRVPVSGLLVRGPL